MRSLWERANGCCVNTIIRSTVNITMGQASDHPPTPLIDVSPLLSKTPMRLQVGELASAPPDVRAVVQEKHDDTVFTHRDIYNARALINREKLGGHTPTAALLKLFDEKEIPYLVKWADDEPNRLVGLVWTFPYCLQMWKQFPKVVGFKLPLFQATGQTCLGTVFNVAFGLIDNERKEGFWFLTKSIRQLPRQHSIREPDVVITDFDKQMKAVLSEVFPDVQQQLCIHHINSNVLLNRSRSGLIHILKAPRRTRAMTICRHMRSWPS